MAGRWHQYREAGVLNPLPATLPRSWRVFIPSRPILVPCRNRFHLPARSTRFFRRAYRDALLDVRLEEKPTRPQSCTPRVRGRGSTSIAACGGKREPHTRHSRGTSSSTACPFWRRGPLVARAARGRRRSAHRLVLRSPAPPVLHTTLSLVRLDVPASSAFNGGRRSRKHCSRARSPRRPRPLPPIF